MKYSGKPRGWFKTRGALVYTFGLLYLFTCQLPQLLIAPFLSRRAHNFQARSFSGFILFLLRSISGLDYQIEGEEHIPPEASIISSNHQSAWETAFFACSKRHIVSVLKIELLWIPVYGLSAYAHGHILINRNKRMNAMRNVIEQGTQRLHSGYDILIFPEGTRKDAEGLGQFSTGAARLAIAANAPIVPAAHNAGLFWPRNSLGKYPGTISLRYGPPIYPEGRSATEITELLEKSVRTLLKALPDKREPN